MHSIVAPSGAARRIQCPQSVTWEAMQPEEETEESREGTAAHWAASEQCEGRLVDVGQVAPNGVVITQEMVDGADMLFDDIVKALEPYGLRPHQGQVEKRVVMSDVHFGTPDYYIVVERPGRPPLVLLWDYKFGHRPVDVWQNAQLVDYLMGITRDLPEDADFVATIVQPRCFVREGPVRRWSGRVVDLRPLFNVSVNSIGEALGPNPRLRTGPECRDCRARAMCPALQREGFACMEESRRDLPLAMAPEAAALELALAERAVERLNARVTGLKAQVEAAARAGKRTPGYRLAQVVGREKWRVPDDQVISTGQALGLNLAKPAEAVTPRQAREAAKAAGLKPLGALLEKMAERPVGGLALEREDPNSAAKVFRAGAAP